MKAYAKAITAAVVTGLAQLAALTADSGLTLHGALVAAAAAAAAFAAVYSVPNAAP